VTDETAPGVEDAPLTKFALGGTRVLGEWQSGEVHGLLSLRFGGKGALLTALLPTVRSGAIRPSVRPVFRYPKRERRVAPIAQIAMVSSMPRHLKEKAIHPSR